MSAPALEVVELTKHYGDFVAVDKISFTVPRGSVVGLLGPNGAGKSTTIQMLMGITTATSGSIRYFGEDFDANRRGCLERINYTSAYNHLQERITVKENLLVFADLYGVKHPKKKIADFGAYFDIEKLMNQRFRNLSAGQRTRVNITKALLNDPELVMMDEPTASLDPDVRDRVMSLVEKLRVERGISILYTSHNMDEIVRLCDEVVFLHQGSIRQIATPAAIAASAHAPQVHIRFVGDGPLLSRFVSNRGHAVDLRENDLLVIDIASAEVPALLADLAAEPVRVVDIDIRKPTLDSAFVQFSREA